MSRKFLIGFVSLAAFGASLLAADLPSAWRSWRYSRPIEQPPGNALSYLTLDRQVFAHSQNQLKDLRIVDESGQELPYDLRSQISPLPQPMRLPATLRENSFVPGQFTQTVLDLGERAKFHNSLRVQTSESDFINWVEVAASDDGHVWRIVNPRAPISRFRKENLEGSQTVRYSENNARYLRVRIQEAGHPFQLSDIEVFASPVIKMPVLREAAIPLLASLAPDSASDASQTMWTVDLGSSNIPIAKFNFETTQPEFYRWVHVMTSADGKEWQPAGGGEMHRYVAGGQTEESLAVQCYESWGSRYWRVAVLNGDDAPLSAVRLSVAMPVRYLLFHPKPDHSYRLIYGNARAAAPRYDLARTVQLPAVEALLPTGLGAEEITSNYADSRPFTERHANILWIALGVAVILLGFTALRALRTPPPPEAGE
jgi:hypothetical protein